VYLTSHFDEQSRRTLPDTKLTIIIGVMMILYYLFVELDVRLNG